MPRGGWCTLGVIARMVVALAGFALFIGGDLGGDRTLRALGVVLVGLALVGAVVRASSWR